MKTKLMQLADNYATAVTERTIVGRVRSRAALEAEVDRVCKDAERYDYLLTKRLGWLSRLAPIPWNKQTMKEAMSDAIDLAMKGKS